MYKYPKICKILCMLLVSLFFLLGCKEEPPKPPPKHKVIRKKITARPPKAKKIITAAAETGNKTDKKETIIADAGKQKVKDAESKKNVSSAKKAKPAKKIKDKKVKDKTSDNLDSELTSIEDISLENESDKYIAYNPKGRIDPFAPLFKEETKNKAPKKTNDSNKPKKPVRPLTPLEKLDLGQLKLVGIISAESGNKALVEEASGKGYIIVKGTYIGIHSGKVVDILKDRIIVEEEDKNMLGHITIRKRELKFQRPAGDNYYEM